MDTRRLIRQVERAEDLGSGLIPLAEAIGALVEQSLNEAAQPGTVIGIELVLDPDDDRARALRCQDGHPRIAGWSGQSWRRASLRQDATLDMRHEGDQSRTWTAGHTWNGQASHLWLMGIPDSWGVLRGVLTVGISAPPLPLNKHPWAAHGPAVMGLIAELGPSLLRMPLPVELERPPWLPPWCGDRCRPALELLRELAPAPAPILLVGETGVGKSHLAAMAHRWSGRPGPFVSVSLGTLGGAPAATTLFGTAEFTGMTPRGGLLDEAERGTLFLDDAHHLPREDQARLLEIVDTGTWRPTGSNVVRRSDVRLIFATTESPTGPGSPLIPELGHRLATTPVHIPPMRERGEELQAWSSMMLGAPELAPPPLSAAALKRLRGQRLEGNLRELRHLVLEAHRVARRERIDPPSIEAAHVAVALRKRHMPDLSRTLADAARTWVAAADHLTDLEDLDNTRVFRHYAFLAAVEALGTDKAVEIFGAASDQGKNRGRRLKTATSAVATFETLLTRAEEE